MTYHEVNIFADLYTLQTTVTKLRTNYSVFTSRFFVTAPNNEYSFASVVTSLPAGYRHN
jgi:hypothetical protein